MKSYHSILENYADYYGEPCLGYYKYDGTNMRFLWTAQNGWCRFGTRNNLIDRSTLLYNQAIEVFDEKYKERLTWMIRQDPLFKGVKEVLAFAEFFGPNSFAGQHKLADKKELVLIDINIGTKGFMDPFTFRKQFKSVDVAKVVYEGEFNTDFASTVRRIGLDTDRQPLFEGAVVKGGAKHKLWMVKVKNRHYIDELTRRQDELNNWDMYSPVGASNDNDVSNDMRQEISHQG